MLLEAELLSLTQGAALPHTPPEEWVLGVVGQSVHAAALACSRADTACKTALHRSRVLNKTSTEGVLLQKSVAFSDVLQLIQNNGGIPFWTLDPSFSSL